MIKERQFVFSRVNMLADVVLCAACVALAHFFRNEILGPYFFPNTLRSLSHLSDYQWLFVATPAFVVFFLARKRYYDVTQWRYGKKFLGAILTSSIQATIGLIVVAFFFRSKGHYHLPQTGETSDAEKVSRAVILSLPVILTIVLSAKTLLIHFFLKRQQRSRQNRRSLLVVGSGDTLRHFIKLISDHPLWGYDIVGIIDDSNREARFVGEIPVVGNLKTLIPYVEKNPIDEVVFLPDRIPLSELTPLFEQCEEMGIRTRLSLNFFRPSIAKPVLDLFENYPVVSYFPTREMNAALMFKYAFDRVAAAVLLVLLSPIFLITAILIKLTSESWRDPIFYGQTRCGLNGKPFTCWKFRSMKVGADKEVDKLRDKNLMGGPVFKMKDDPRITPIGKFIRKTSIDELPQLWNVLRGEMSLVGPRPPIPSEVEKYDRWQRRRLSMKPGITCLWQVSGRNKLPFDVWMKLDLEYIDNWSLWLDFKILLKTVYVVATGYGAM